MNQTKRPSRWIWIFVFLPLSGCEMVQNLPYVGKGLPEAESKAIGAGCRHAGRAIEDCYAINPRASRSGVFAGWREMNDYMASNKIGEVKPLVAANTPPPSEPVAKADDHDTDHEDDAPADDGHGNDKKKTVVHADDHATTDAKSGKADKNGKADKSTKGGKGDKSELAAKDEPSGKDSAKPGDKGKEKASAKYVSSADRPPPVNKTSPRPRWEPGKKDKDEEESPRVWERKPRT